MGLLFEKMDTRGTGTIDWDEFCTYMMQDLQDKERLGNEREVRTSISAFRFFLFCLEENSGRGGEVTYFTLFLVSDWAVALARMPPSLLHASPRHRAPRPADPEPQPVSHSER